MTPGLAIIVLGLAVVPVVAAAVRTWRQPSAALVRVGDELGALRNEIAGYRAAHENQSSSLDRRLLGLEQTAARAANEVRMVSDQFLAQLPTERSTDENEARR